MLAPCPSFSPVPDPVGVRVRRTHDRLLCGSCGRLMDAADTEGSCPAMIPPDLAMRLLLPAEVLERAEAEAARPKLVVPGA